MPHSEQEAYQALVIGSSWGGIEALKKLLGQLPAEFPLTIIVVQHQHPHAAGKLAYVLNKTCLMPVSQVEDKTPLKPGEVYVAPANYHLLVENDRTAALDTSAPIHFCRPAVDVLFESAARVYRQHLIGLVLTGANEDGAAGALVIKQKGGRVLVQDPAEAEAPIMPAAALRMVSADAVLSLRDMPAYLVQLVMPGQA